MIMHLEFAAFPGYPQENGVSGTRLKEKGREEYEAFNLRIDDNHYGGIHGGLCLVKRRGRGDNNIKAGILGKRHGEEKYTGRGNSSV